MIRRGTPPRPPPICSRCRKTGPCLPSVRLCYNLHADFGGRKSHGWCLVAELDTKPVYVLTGHWGRDCTVPPSEWPVLEAQQQPPANQASLQPVRSREAEHTGEVPHRRLAKRQRGQPLESNSDVGGSQSSSEQSESDDNGSTSGDASDIEDADGGSQGASDSDGGGVAEQEGRKYSTSIGKRCKKWINVCFNRGMQFLENYSKKEWTRQTAADNGPRAEGQDAAEDQAQQARADDGEANLAGGIAARSGGVQDADAAGSDAVEGAADEIVAPTGAGAAAKAPRKRKPLIDPECFMAFVRPDGRVEYSSSAGIRNLPLVRNHRDNFVASLELFVRQ